MNGMSWLGNEHKFMLFCKVGKQSVGWKLSSSPANSTSGLIAKGAEGEWREKHLRRNGREGKSQEKVGKSRRELISRYPSQFPHSTSLLGNGGIYLPLAKSMLANGRRGEGHFAARKSKQQSMKGGGVCRAGNEK